MSLTEEEVRSALYHVLSSKDNLDDEVLAYFTSMVYENQKYDKASLIETLGEFLEAYSFVSEEDSIEIMCEKISKGLGCLNITDQKVVSGVESVEERPKLLEKVVVLSDVVKQHISSEEQASLDTLWGFDKIRWKRNDTFESTEATSARSDRKAAREQKRFLDDVNSKFDDEDDEDQNAQISAMVLPDYSSNSREKDIQVLNFNITFGGQLLLEDADLRIVYGRRYGLVGRNGIGKTTLLRHMASFDIEGFPKHHRVLHVKQEVNSTNLTVLQTVLESDVERKALLEKEKLIIQKQQLSTESFDSSEAAFLAQELEEVYERLSIIGSQTAEARAASILSGLRFSDEMQASPVSSLSGGWRMRVSLASALFIEPDLLMLDEPTNHLDLEAVLWLQDYLQTYPNTVLVVSHDRAFLNEICTDIILFKDRKLTYFRGNYDMFEQTYEEFKLVQQRQREGQLAKIAHMQEFVDKFRYNAKRASLVQSRIKAIEKETVVEEIVEDAKFSFSFPEVGELGRPVIEMDAVSFGYNSSSTGKMKLLFENVHFGVDQSSRIALVGPNGSGKSTLLKLIQGQLTPVEGSIRVNPQLRLGIFTQHHLDSFDLRLSAIENMQKRWPSALEPELRSHLGRFEIHGNDAIKPLKFTSGGQKSRVAFACLTYTKPHVVILDEPTNHLDMNAIEALIQALRTFGGGVLVVSHDQHFISSICNEIWVLGNRQVRKLNGDIGTYKRMVIKSLSTSKK